MGSSHPQKRHPHAGLRRIAGHVSLLPALILTAILLLAVTGTIRAADEMPASSDASQASGSMSTMTPAPASGAMAPAGGDAVNAATGTALAAIQPTAAELPEDSDSLLGPEAPTRVRIAILDATGKPGGANKIAVLLSEYKRQALEDLIGMQIELVNLSTAETVRPGQSTLFYRPEFLRAALAMAKAIPGEQFVEPMRPAGLKRAGVDVEIVVGKELP